MTLPTWSVPSWEQDTALPWEAAQGAIYNRVVSVHRSRTNAVVAGVQQIGLVGYSGREQSTDTSDAEGEAVLLTGLPASIQAKRSGRTRGMMLPGDVVQKAEWEIFIAADVIAQYSVRDRDIVVDDEQYRYEVANAYWTTFGYQLMTVRLET